MTDARSGRGPAAGERPAAPAIGAIGAPALRSSVWAIGGYATSQVVRFASNLILTRLLFPAVFGQMALVYTFMQGLQMFSDVGIGPAVVQSPRGDDPRFLNTAWTIACARGVILWLCSCAIAAPVAAFYDQPRLTVLLPVAGLSAILAGFESTSIHQVQRHLRLERLTVLEFVAQVLGTVATILLALVDRRWHGANNATAVWAIVGGSLTSSLTRLVLTHTIVPGVRNRFDLDREAMRKLFRFGRWIFVSTLLTFLAGQSDRLVFGKMIPLELFGVYGIAATLAALPTQAVLKLGGMVVFPAYSRLVARSDFKQIFGRVRLPLLLGGAAIVTGLIACGPFLVRVLYDRRYAEAGWILQYLAAAAWFQILECTNGSALLAQGLATWVAAGNAAKLVGFVFLIPLGFHLGGFGGALFGLVLSDALKYATSAVGVASRGLFVFARDVLLTAAIAAVSFAGFLTGRAALASAHVNLVALLAAAGVAGGVWGGAVLWYVRRDASERARAAVDPSPSV